MIILKQLSSAIDEVLPDFEKYFNAAISADN